MLCKRWESPPLSPAPRALDAARRQTTQKRLRSARSHRLQSLCPFPHSGAVVSTWVFDKPVVGGSECGLSPRAPCALASPRLVSVRTRGATVSRVCVRGALASLRAVQ